MSDLFWLIPLAIAILSVICGGLIARVLYLQRRQEEIIEWIKEDSELISQFEARFTQLERDVSSYRVPPESNGAWGQPPREPPPSSRTRFLKMKHRDIRS